MILFIYIAQKYTKIIINAHFGVCFDNDEESNVMQGNDAAIDKSITDC